MRRLRGKLPFAVGLTVHDFGATADANKATDDTEGVHESISVTTSDADDLPLLDQG